LIRPTASVSASVNCLCFGVSDDYPIFYRNSKQATSDENCNCQQEIKIQMNCLFCLDSAKITFDFVVLVAAVVVVIGIVIVVVVVVGGGTFVSLS
jgi:hypothetical protein